MHAANVNRVVRHLRESAGPPTAAPTDRQLLVGFCAGGDQAAFAKLVGRHGAMVLRVCRRVLRHEQDAEDAFQATFLVLAKKATSVRRTEALASWLHGVAHRVALRAKRDAGRRRAHEREARVMPAGVATSEADWREVQAALDEEIGALPEKYRAPFVLCFLEGKSRTEAAGELGLKEGTIWSRLSQARKLLQERLARRGIALPVLLAAVAISDGAACAVPAGLLDTTVRAVLCTDSVPARAAALARGVSRTMPTIKVNALFLALVTTGLLAFGGVFLKADVPAPPPTEGQTEPEPVSAAQPVPGAQKPPPAPDPEDPKFAGHFSGRVNGPDGKPLGGARVFLVPYYGEKKEAGPVRATTDADGRFEFDAPDMTYTEFDGLPARREGFLFVTKDGHGPDWFHTWGHKTGYGFRTHWDPVKGAELNLHLAKDDVPIRGRFLDPDGKPLAGARVRLSRLMVPLRRDLDAYLKLVSGANALYLSIDYERDTYRPLLIPGLTTEARTDADGRFTLSGLGRDRLAVLDVSAPGVADTTLTVMTRDAPDVGGFPVNGKATQVIHGAGFTLQLRRGLTVKGLVRDRDTKAPVPGMWVTKYWNPLTAPSHTTGVAVTDENGRFAINGLDPELLNYKPEQRDITAIPRPGSRYLTAKGLIERDADVVIECVRGIAFRLKLVDEQGKPVEGNVEYYPIDPNPQIEDLIRPLQGSNWPVMNRAARRADGTYEGFVLPGPGAVVVEMPNRRSYRPAHVDPKAFFAPGRTDWPEHSFSLYGTHNTLAGIGCWYDQHDYAAIVLVNPAKGSGPLELSATVVRDRPRRVSLVDPDGKPVVGAVAHLYEKRGPYSIEERLRAASFPLTGLQPDRDQRITFVKSDRRLIGVLKARGDGDTPYTVRMQPWGSVTGRFVDADGKPLKTPLGNGEGPLVGNDDPEGSAFSINKVEADGRFRIDGLVPGQSYSCVRIYRHVGTLLPATAFEKLVLGSGEVRNVGDIRINPPGGAKPRK
jgi:RNA polymerase sigma factor (sigma-70 family)